MALTVFLAIFSAAGSVDTDEWRYRELVYQAEVFGREEESLAELRALLRKADTPAEREAAARAISVIKRGGAGAAPALAELRLPRAVLAFQGEAWALVGGHWLELGDWLGDYFLLDLQWDAAAVAGPGGERRTIAFRNTPATPPPDGDFCWLADADAADVLTFIAKREGLNSFIPSALECPLRGAHPLASWAALLDRVCAEAGVYRTRRRDSVVFHLSETEVDLPVGRIERVERKNENLAMFLHGLAENLDMELVMDDRLADVSVDIHLQDQPWDEVLDCLSLLNGFAWFLDRSGARPRLFIQKE